MLGHSKPQGIGLRLVRGFGMMIIALTASGSAAQPAATTTLDCGANVLFVLLHLEGRPVTLDQLERALPPRRTKGYSMAELAAASATLGLRLDGARFDKGDQVLTRPAIAFFKSAKGGHFAVLRPVGTTGTMVQVIDPPRVSRICDYTQVLSAKSWTGRILIVRDAWVLRRKTPLLIALAGCILLVMGLSRMLQMVRGLGMRSAPLQHRQI
jgi:ABC-type bacteriocin/lantibiotic exporter with double-glycine peptidase domain